MAHLEAQNCPKISLFWSNNFKKITKISKNLQKSQKIQKNPLLAKIPLQIHTKISQKIQFFHFFSLFFNFFSIFIIFFSKIIQKKLQFWSKMSPKSDQIWAFLEKTWFFHFFHIFFQFFFIFYFIFFTFFTKNSLFK